MGQRRILKAGPREIWDEELGWGQQATLQLLLSGARRLRVWRNRGRSTHQQKLQN